MLHDCHKLDGVVSQLMNAGEGVLSKFLVGADAIFMGGNPDVCFVDTCTLWWRRSFILEDISLLRWRIPETSVINGRNGEILGDTSNPRWYPLHSA